MKYHFGCGTRYLDGYIHVDAIAYAHVDIISDLRELGGVADSSADEIYACHVLEHFNRSDVDHVLSHWRSKLKAGGVLRLSVPDFASICSHYSQHKEITALLGLLYGGQTYDLNFHHMCFDFDHLASVLRELGFQKIERYDWRTFLPDDYDDFSKAYLPHLDFNNGQLMSLNIVCEKAR